ncbi:GntR family transcriptional regulator [Brachybacterium sp. MASK1Z-5]|uniref:GntR family transcriptional regulator n=1 Tax=Brachybacterium halotolerans TaxID=2795215 RepID=A0ABS1BE32_9MICO|nr:GntR family transcriptional regulator [Brachybacterium halotolerans]MBK0332904.1 GntR family transcriptional regulator [Brachybacterium halotolerans]
MSSKRQALRADVQEGIQNRLVQGNWRPGARLSIDGLARELEVSPTPVREALVALEHSGLIEYQALKGFVVAPPLTPQQIDELIDARLVLELAAFTRAFGRREALESDLRAAHEAHSAIAERIAAAPEPDYALIHEYFDADSAFHEALFRHAGNHYLGTMREVLNTHGHRMRQTWSEGAERIDADEAVAEHAAILEKVQEHNHDGALRALRSHLEGVRERSIELGTGPTGR